MLAAADTATINSDFYNSAASAIPTLWIAIGFATNTLSGLMRYLRTETTGDIQARTFTSNAGMKGQTITFPFGKIRLGTGLQLEVTPERQRGFASWLFIIILVMTGLVGEAVAFYVLWSRHTSDLTDGIVGGCVALLALLTGFIIVVAVVASSNPPESVHAPIMGATDAPAEKDSM